MDNLNKKISSVKFLNHSSVIIDSGSTRILCDPWFKGAAFGNSWRLLVENSHSLNDLEYDYIFLSHEHPDHFSIPTLKELNGPKIFLYQKTQDKKVVKYLEAQGHTVIEFDHGIPNNIGDISVSIYVVDGYDSAVLFKLPNGESVLNINDCRIELDTDLVMQMKKDAGGGIDLCLMQFSYANWAGNQNDSIIPELLHTQTLDRNKIALDILKPTNHLLFASYVFFSHTENYYWNDYFWLAEMERKLSKYSKSKIIVPIPDENFLNIDNMKREYTNSSAIEFWSDAHANKIPIDDQVTHFSIEELTSGFDLFVRNVWADNSLQLAQEELKRIPLEILVSDLDVILSLDLIEGTFSTRHRDQRFDIQVSSETVDFLFKNKFARGTVTINGRIQFNYPTAFRFFVFFFISYANNIGRTFGSGKLTKKDIYSINHTSVLSAIHEVDPAGIGELSKYLE